LELTPGSAICGVVPLDDGEVSSWGVIADVLLTATAPPTRRANLAEMRRKKVLVPCPSITCLL
jgi:hypothetical protein